jgi:hypothetical protein
VPVAVPRTIAEADRRNPNLILPLVLQLRSWENVSVYPIYDSRPGCATGSLVRMIDDDRNVQGSLIDHVEGCEIAHADGTCRQSQLFASEIRLRIRTTNGRIKRGC